MNLAHGQYLYIHTNMGLVAEMPKKGSALLRITQRNQGIVNATIAQKQRVRAGELFIEDNQAALIELITVMKNEYRKDTYGGYPDSLEDAINDLEKLLTVE